VTPIHLEHVGVRRRKVCVNVDVVLSMSSCQIGIIGRRNQEPQQSLLDYVQRALQ
jgi:hypothetical protein